MGLAKARTICAGISLIVVFKVHTLSSFGWTLNTVDEWSMTGLAEDLLWSAFLDFW